MAPPWAFPQLEFKGAVTGGAELSFGPAVKYTAAAKGAVIAPGYGIGVTGGVKLTFRPRGPQGLWSRVISRFGKLQKRDAPQAATAAEPQDATANGAGEPNLPSPQDAGGQARTASRFWTPIEKLSVSGAFVYMEPSPGNSRIAFGVQWDLEQGGKSNTFLTFGPTRKNIVFDGLNGGVKVKVQEVAPGVWSAVRDGVRNRSYQTFREGFANAFAKAELSAGTDISFPTDTAPFKYGALNLTAKGTVAPLSAPVAGPYAGAANFSGLVVGMGAGTWAGGWTRDHISVPLGMNPAQQRVFDTGAGGAVGLSVGAATRKGVEWAASFEAVQKKLLDPVATKLAPIAEKAPARWAGKILTNMGPRAAGVLGAGLSAIPDAAEAYSHFRNGDNAEGRKSVYKALIRGGLTGVGVGLGFFFGGGIGSVGGAMAGGYVADKIIENFF